MFDGIEDLGPDDPSDQDVYSVQLGGQLGAQCVTPPPTESKPPA